MNLTQRGVDPKISFLQELQLGKCKIQEEQIVNQKLRIHCYVRNVSILRCPFKRKDKAKSREK